jgi:hypothetical protein
MEDKDLELIERYYRHDLKISEQTDFERRLADDVAFREAAHLHADALEAIRMEGTAMLRARLAAKGRELDAGTDKPGSRWLWWIIGLGAVLLGTWAVWWSMQPVNPSPQMPTIESRDIIPSPATDTLPALPPPEKQSEPVQKTPDAKRVFAAWFQPYKDASLEPMRRGDTEHSPSERFQQLYWDGDYRAALTAFDSLGAFAKNNDNLLFIKANCLLATGKAAAAGALLERLGQNGQSRFKAQLPWYLALSRLQGGRRKEADVLLRQIASDPGSPLRADAERLLKDLK